MFAERRTMRSDTERGLWSDFDTVCKNAEDAFEAAVREAALERDQVINVPANWQARDRVTAAAEARYGRKEQAAQATRDEKCKRAEGALSNGLDAREADERRLKAM
jgi:hypothetical protein